ncbi:MAG TPA: hypothetical protein VMT43_08235 [Acidimicrobiales bacterium]|nr:hypothetical protein [Acidimicrobiales bacterium]
MSSELGLQFAKALAAKDREALLGLFDPALDFRALTPRKPWESTSAAEVVDDIILGAWFDPGDAIQSLDDVEVGNFADRDKVRYQLRVTNADGDFAVEQEAYFTVDNDRINWIRILCSGYCPVEAGATTS